jgi:hypothetical protein
MMRQIAVVLFLFCYVTVSPATEATSQKMQVSISVVSILKRPSERSNSGILEVRFTNESHSHHAWYLSSMEVLRRNVQTAQSTGVLDIGETL